MAEGKRDFQFNPVNRSFDQDELLFDLLAEDDGKVSLAKFWSAIRATGIRTSDSRLKECWDKFKAKQKEATGETFSTYRVDKDTFKECIADDIQVILKAFKNDMVIPEFKEFSSKIAELHENCKNNIKGKVATYIPQLARMSHNIWAVSVCTIDGQRFNIGDSLVPFCIQSCSKPLNYALAVSDLGATRVHQFVGQEPSGRSSNDLMLDYNNQPHNPMINSGAIIVTSLLKTKMQIADRFDYVFSRYKQCAGGEFVGFSNATYLSEREAADRNYALGYYMREKKCFPDNTNLKQTLEFYFQLCSVEVNAESASVIAATLANGGICPTTGERVLAGDAVRNTLSLMHSCGMYDYSGQFAFKVGLPAKSSVTGAILLVVPNVMGICCWSPPLDEMGNSCRGVQFCEELVHKFYFHNYDELTVSCEHKQDPRKRSIDIAADAVVNLLFGAANGDVTAIRRFAMTGMDMTASDYDGRTALHLACAEGHLPVVRMLLEQCEVPSNPRDRWGHLPIDDARRFNHSEIVQYIELYEEKYRLGCPPRRRISAALAQSPSQYRCASPYSMSPVCSRRSSSLVESPLLTESMTGQLFSP